jgi:ligand-binding SRPBCC domain-containing protein
VPRIELHTLIRAPRERVFDLARDIDAHVASTPGTAERAVAGITSGLINLGEVVTWEARHFGVKQRLTVRISAMQRPESFRDEMVTGAFASMVHDHRFEERDGHTLMIDDFVYRAPLGPLGWLAERLFLTRYLHRFLRRRADILRRMAESSVEKA